MGALYNVRKDVEWGEVRWCLWADGCSNFGVYPTKALLMKDVRHYKLKLKDK